MQHPTSESVLLITLDSCRYDTFEAAAAPTIKALGPLYRAEAPAYFTYASHAAMFMGFTPGVAGLRQPLVNPKFAKFFKMVGGGWSGKGGEWTTLEGQGIIDGFQRKGYRTIGTSGMGWFDPQSECGKVLTRDFDRFWYSGNSHSLRPQVSWLGEQIRASDGRPVFAFLNVGETHVPYFHEDADWDGRHNPCVPFSDHNDAAECRRRQIACVEWVDGVLRELLDAFAGGLTIVCADHGDCWGEDGCWEHGFYHPKVVEVPLVFRLPETA